MIKQTLVIAFAVSALVLGGCASKGKKAAPAPAPVAQNSGLSSNGMSDSNLNANAYNANANGNGSALPSDLQKVVYFELDSTDLTSEGQLIVQKFGTYLSSNPSARLRLEGHADERGTREYNVGLGERRANSVQSALVAAGASASQLSVLSYGEERPAAPGHDDAAWALNRRVELVQQ